MAESFQLRTMLECITEQLLQLYQGYSLDWAKARYCTLGAALEILAREYCDQAQDLDSVLIPIVETHQQIHGPTTGLSVIRRYLGWIYAVTKHHHGIYNKLGNLGAIYTASNSEWPQNQTATKNKFVAMIYGIEEYSLDIGLYEKGCEINGVREDNTPVRSIDQHEIIWV